MPAKQLTLCDVEPTHTDYQVRKWTRKYVEYCDRICQERGSSFTGEYCCGYHWCCDKCKQTLCNGCADCVHTIKQIARELQIKIDYSDFDFEKLERRIREAYEKYKEGGTDMNETERKKMKEEFEALAKVAEGFINKYGNPHSAIIIEQGSIRFYEGEMALSLKILD